jgi:hypothetical protein
MTALEVKVKFSPPIILEKRELTLSLNKGENSVENVIKKCLALLWLPEKKWDEVLGEEVSTLHTRLLIKNGKVIGRFATKSLVLMNEKEKWVEDGDEFIIYAPAGGG